MLSIKNNFENNTSNKFYDNQIDNQKYLEYNWIFLFVVIFIFAGGLGNILVCLAVGLDRKLQNVTNYFLFSLAIADLLVSLFVMPLGAIPSFLGYWPFGVLWCNVYVTCDVLACSSSILHMCFISIGRYMGIKNPLGSRHRSTKRLASIKISIVWVMAMLVSSSITVLGIINKSNIMPQPKTCVINNRAFFVFGSLIAFYIPMIMMVITYALTIHLLKKKARFAAQNSYNEMSRRLGGGGRFTIKPQYKQHTKSISTNKCLIDLQQQNQNYFLKENLTKKNVSIKPESTTLLKTQHRFCWKSQEKSTINTERIFNSRNKRTNLSANAVATEQKATKVLGLVFFTFVLCWSPFFILNIFFAACPNCYVSRYVIDTCLWLGYVSSTINPIIYTIFNKTFRAAFIRLLKCNCERSAHIPRYRSVTEGGRGAISLCAPAAFPLAISLQGTSLLASSDTNETPLDDFRNSFRPFIDNKIKNSQ